MFIRFVRSSGTSGKNRGIYFKIAVICLTGAIGVSFFNTVICHITGADSMLQWISDTAYEKTGKATWSMYRYMMNNEYNAASYADSISSSDDKDSITTDIVEVINSQNNLYSYMSETSAEISVSYYDPSYTEKEFGGTMVVDGETEPQTKNEQPTGKQQETGEKPQIAESMASGYVIPTVAPKGTVYSMEQLSDFDFLMSNLYIVPDRAKVLESELVASEMLAKDMTMQGDNSKPQILIYHTHSQEGFADSVKGDESTTIVGVGAYLAKILSEVYGYNVIHCTEKFDMKSGSLDRSEAYTYAGYTVTQILEDNPSIEVVLDIHRDGLADGADKLVTNINGKETAKIMFFNGVSRSSASGDIDYLYNRYKKDNLAFSFQLKLKALECYPEFTRRNYIDAYQYNLHLRPKSVLVEVGAQNNTLQEELNAMEVLAEVLHQVLQ